MTSAALSHIMQVGGVTRAELATHTGLSRVTSSQALSRLQALGLVRTNGTRSGARGPAAGLYELVPTIGTAVGIALYAEVIRVELCGLDGSAVASVEAPLTDDVVGSVGLPRPASWIRPPASSPSPMTSMTGRDSGPASRPRSAFPSCSATTCTSPRLQNGPRVSRAESRTSCCSGSAVGSAWPVSSTERSGSAAVARPARSATRPSRAFRCPAGWTTSSRDPSSASSAWRPCVSSSVPRRRRHRPAAPRGVSGAAR